MRLTNAIRKSVMTSVIEKAFGKLFQKATDNLNKACWACFCEMYAKQMAVVETVRDQALADTLFKQRANPKLRINHVTVKTFYNIFSQRATYEFFITLPYRYQFGTAVNDYDNYFEVTQKNCPAGYADVVRRANELETLQTTILAARKQLETLLMSCTTDKKVLELAPELAEYFPKPVVALAGKQLVPMELVASVRGLLQGIKP